MTRYCEDCAYCKTKLFVTDKTALRFARCEILFENPGPEALVSKEFKPDNLYCSSARMPGADCGPEGNLWTEKLEIRETYDV